MKGYGCKEFVEDTGQQLRFMSWKRDKKLKEKELSEVKG